MIIDDGSYGKPHLIYEHTTKRLKLQNTGYAETYMTLPNSFNGKRVVFSLTKKGRGGPLPVVKASISNYSSTLTQNSALSAANYYKFKMSSQDSVIYKSMYSPNFYDFDSEEYHKIMIQEKLNGSYVLSKLIIYMGIFNFNHIDKIKTKEEIAEIKELYKYYHYRYWCYPKVHKDFKKLNLLINMSSTGLIAIGAVAGCLTLNPAILGIISGAGLALKTFSETKDYKHKIEMSKFAYTTYQKVLLDLRTALRGGSFNKNDLIKELNILDDTITDFGPLVTKFEK